jgi:hypothetical protein
MKMKISNLKNNWIFTNNIYNYFLMFLQIYIYTFKNNIVIIGHSTS